MTRSNVITPKQYRAIQKLGEAFMADDIEIYHIETAAKDPDNPWGDDTVTFEQTPTITRGWMKSLIDSQPFQSEPGFLAPVHDYVLRLPAGTRIAAGDKVKAQHSPVLFRVIDENYENTWQEWTVARVRRIE